MTITKITLEIPVFLRSENRPSAPPRYRHTRQKWIMPPPALMPTLRAVKRGHDTLGKLRGTLRKYDDKQIRAALHALIRSGDVEQRGHRYLPTK